ncbi:Uncharacterised protein [Mycobacterium xenopi]|uniref:Uncharacterized protein n=1 Tax=Mycobacterium xenopi TaxID=1789 RepID=A0AAD1H144_MYCXE|nr:hypothetical protein MYXE_22170 [Mycobacterium xenopi]SPX78303.1 Uncharacterised protein [Mycobacterium xenopi]
MAGNRKPTRPRRTPPASRPAAFPGPSANALGQPGQAGRPYVTQGVYYTVVPILPGGREPDPAGSPGKYRLTFVLAIPGRAVVLDEVNFAKLIAAGDSLLEVASDVHTLRMDGHDDAGNKHALTVNVNGQHRLRDIELEVDADSFMHAASRGHDLIAPALSRWAYLHDAPITTSGFQIIELATGTQLFWVNRMLGAVKAFADTGGASHQDHRILLSAYRDGISSTEPLWQALSLFRLIEGAFKMQGERRAALIAAGRQPPQVECVPADVTTIGQENDYGLRDSLKPYAGQKFTQVRDTIRGKLRNAIAHLDIDSDILIQDRWEDVQKVEQVLPCLRWMARQLLDAELQQTPLQ